MPVIYSTRDTFSYAGTDWAVALKHSFKKMPDLYFMTFFGWLYSNGATDTAYFKCQIIDATGAVVMESSEAEVTGVTATPKEVYLNVEALSNYTWYLVKYLIRSSTAGVPANLYFPVTLGFYD